MANLILKGNTSGQVTIQAPDEAGTTTLTLPLTSSTLATQNALGVRNLIINGDMRIDQRNAGASVTPTDTGGTTYHVDRFLTRQTQASKFSIQQNAGSVTPPEGFSNYLGVTSLSSYSSLSSDLFSIQQRIEGNNITHLAWGTSNAKTVTLSFWVRSSLTGTFGGSIQNGSQDRGYPFSYTISSANTWEKKTITIDGDTTGTWVTTNAVALIVHFNLGTGADRTATAGTWAAGNLWNATGATSVLGTNGATLYITGVQLEVGEVATEFEHRPYDMELARCQRYLQTSYNYGTAITASSTGVHVGERHHVGQGSVYYATNTYFHTEMRANPSITIYYNDGTTNSIGRAAGWNNGTSFNTGWDNFRITQHRFNPEWNMNGQTASVRCYLFFDWKAEAEL